MHRLAPPLQMTIGFYHEDDWLMRLSIVHRTRYEFAEPIAHALQRVRLTPKATQGQEILDWSMELENASAELEYDDHHFNHTSLLAIEPGASEVIVTCRGAVDTQDSAGVIGHHSGHLPLWSFLSQTRLTKPGPQMRALMRELPSVSELKPLEYLHALSGAISEQVRYTKGETDPATSAEDALVAAMGVCQDHAHVFIGIARAAGIPARYVSGYLMMNDRIDQEATHAWAEAHVEGLGWVGFDISNGISPDPRYVRVATGFDYRDAAPLTGISFGGTEELLSVEVAVEQQKTEQ